MMDAPLPRVFAVVVTFNRRGLLEQCLAALLAQTLPCTRIILIDNASSDDTAEHLSGLGDPRVMAYGLSKNTGGAGGFNVGMRLAFAQGADHVWIMDDDVIPDPTALEALLEGAQALKARGVDPAFTASVVRTPDGVISNVPDVDLRENGLGYPDWPAHLDLAALPISRATFVSVLIPRAVVARFGLPIAPMFIWGDDTEYTLRITRQRPGYVIGASRVEHVRAMAGTLSIRTEDNPVRIGFHKLLIRNTLYLTRTHLGRAQVLTFARRRLDDILWLVSRRQFAKAAVILGGLWDGLRFKPTPEAADSPFSVPGLELKLLGSRAD
jgi:dTDP-4-dehydrorhamnose reductase